MPRRELNFQGLQSRYSKIVKLLPPSSQQISVFIILHCASSSTQSWYFVAQFWDISPAVGLTLVLLCSPNGNRNFWRKTKHHDRVNDADCTLLKLIAQLVYLVYDTKDWEGTYRNIHEKCLATCYGVSIVVCKNLVADLADQNCHLVFDLPPQGPLTR